VLITGTAGGMGAAAAMLFTEAGATVVGGDIHPATSRGAGRLDRRYHRLDVERASPTPSPRAGSSR
jgi:NAD(P)-dependent dehydrogenase (short-subunit alcohol dehydrogenase family)